MALQVKVLTTKAHDQSSIPGTQKVEGETWLPRVVLQQLHTGWDMRSPPHRHKITLKQKKKHLGSVFWYFACHYKATPVGMYKIAWPEI